MRSRPTQPCTARLLVHTPATTSIVVHTSDDIDRRRLCHCRSEEQRSPSEHFWVGISKYRANIVQDVVASAAVFIPVGVINFRYVPLAWRTPFCSAFGLLFPIIVSWQRGAQVVEGRQTT